MTTMSSPQWKLDVFVSFKSEDTEGSFQSDLFKRLKQLGIGYFSDGNAEEARGDFERECERLEVLRQVRFALVLFCESYVSSNRCLRGLVDLLHWKRYHDLVVIPIYLLTDMALVSNWASRDESAVALESTEVSQRAAKKEEWTNALKEAEKIPGYYLNAANGEPTPDRSKLIDKIVERLVNEIHSLYPAKDFGPFGDEGRISWRSGKINGIDVVVYTNYIKSIAFEVEDDTDTEQQNASDGNDSTYKVKFKDGEYITSFAGYFDNNEKRIKSLKFRTNKRMLGPCGTSMDGDYFSVPSKGGEVTEFFGRHGDFLTSIGARVKLHSEKFRPVNVQSVGLIGEKGGSKWDDGNQHANVRRIIVKLDSSSEAIGSIVFQYEEKNGELSESEIHGDVDGNNSATKEIEMDPDVYLTSIFALRKGDNIKYLTFLTNKNRIETIGAEEKNNEKDATYPFLAPDAKIVGFYGWHNGHLYGIGAYFEREPFGSEDAWEDGNFAGVREINLFFDKSSAYIRYIRFVYDDGSKEGASIVRGDYVREGRLQERKCVLDYPREYLTSISGCTGENGAIQSLTFHSNKNIYFSGRSRKGTFFWYPSTGSRITGFYGTCDGKTLKSIGVYAEAIPHMYPFKTNGPFGDTRHGDEWNDGVHTDVRAFRVSVSNEGDVLHSISFMYDDNGSLVEGRQHGGGNAGKWIWLDFPYERLSSIIVWECKDGEEIIISRLKITTTARDTDGNPKLVTYGPYPAGEPNKVAVKRELGFVGYKMVGFFGRAVGSYLNAIGAHLEKK